MSVILFSLSSSVILTNISVVALLLDVESIYPDFFMTPGAI